MALYSIKSVQKLPISLEQAWGFYSDPANLKLITPPEMKFRIISQDQGKMIYPGQIIEYKVSPLSGIPLYWMSEITYVQAPSYFVDEQRKGPYAFWQHQHHFEAVEGGVAMTDLIYYRNPLGWLGRLSNSWFIRKKLLSIFEYRFHRAEELFGAWPGEPEIYIELR